MDENNSIIRSRGLLQIMLRQPAVAAFMAEIFRAAL